MKQAVKTILYITIIAFIIQLFSPTFTDSFLLKQDVFERPWILLTSIFLHGSFSHILFNMYVLVIFGSLLEQRIGAKRFTIIYLVSGVLASLISSFFYSSALGASGALMGILGVLIILMPNLKLLFFFIVPMDLWVAGIIIAFIDVVGAFNPLGNVGNIAHLTGMAIGLIYGLLIKKQVTRFRGRFNSKTHLDQDDIDDYMRSGRI